MDAQGGFTMLDKKTNELFYTTGEEIFNAVTHGIGSVLAIAGTGALLALSDRHTWLICLVYGLSLVLLYTMSTLYHSFSGPNLKHIFRVFDHASIFLLIAGSYTPFTLILLRGTVKGPVICGIVWAAAILGVILNAISVKRFEKLSMLLYVAMGWAVVFAIGDVVRALPPAGFWLLLLGGISYTAGIIFYAWHKKFHTHYIHGVWHLFVLAGSVLHFICVFLYVLPMA